MLLAAYRFHTQPNELRSWAITALVTGAFSLVAMGGFVIGAALAITGAILGLFASRPTEDSRVPPAAPPAP